MIAVQNRAKQSSLGQPAQLVGQRKSRLARDHLPLLLILLFFVALGTLYNYSLPLFEAPDEMAHFRYVNWFAAGNPLPNMRTDLQTIGHEVGQTPLYYLCLAPFVALTDTSDLEQIAPSNPYWRQGGGITVHYHTAAERFPYRYTSLAVHLARLLSTLISLVTITSAYGLARLIIPNHASMAAALVAFNPQFVFISATVNNDTLVTAFSGLTLLCLAHALVSPRAPWWRNVLLGVLWGAAALSKLSGLALGGPILLGFLLSAWRRNSWRPLLSSIPLVTAGVSVSAGWWFIRNWHLYGDPLAWQEILNANSGLVRHMPLSWLDALNYSTFLHRSFWAMFGYGVSAPSSFYWIVNTLGLVCMAGLALWLANTGLRQLSYPTAIATLCLLVWVLIAYFTLLRWMRLVEATNQGRLLFPVISSLAVLLTLGSAHLSGRRNWLGITLTVFLTVWATLSPLLIIQPAYAQPKPLSTNLDIPNPTSARFGEEVELLGYRLPHSVAMPGESLSVELYWQASRPISESYAVSLHAVDSSGRVVAGLDTIPSDGRYPTAVWQMNHPFRDSYSLPIQSTAAAGQATLFLVLYPWGRPDIPLPVSVGHAQVGHSLTLTTFKIPTSKQTALAPTRRTDISFGQLANLSGFDMPERVLHGQTFTVTLYWQAIAPDGNDYTVFAHLLDDSGSIVTQADSPPLDNRYPTSIWDANEQIRDPHTFHLPSSMGSGRYRLEVGLYDPASGHRLTATGTDGDTWAENSVFLGYIEFAGVPETPTGRLVRFMSVSEVDCRCRPNPTGYHSPTPAMLGHLANRSCCPAARLRSHASGKERKS